MSDVTGLLEREYGGNVFFLVEAKDIGGGLRLGSDEESRSDAGKVHAEGVVVLVGIRHELLHFAVVFEGGRGGREVKGEGGRREV